MICQLTPPPPPPKKKVSFGDNCLSVIRRCSPMTWQKMNNAGTWSVVTFVLRFRDFNETFVYLRMAKMLSVCNTKISLPTIFILSCFIMFLAYEGTWLSSEYPLSLISTHEFHLSPAKFLSAKFIKTYGTSNFSPDQ